LRVFSILSYLVISPISIPGVVGLVSPISTPLF
jgi:hypothetical protein